MEDNDILVTNARAIGAEAMIRTTYDPKADAMFIRFAADGVLSARTDEVLPGVMLNFDKAGALISIEELGIQASAAAHP